MIQKNDGASEDAIGRAVISLKNILGGAQIPKVLISRWRCSDGFQGDQVEFYSTSEIGERNETLEVCIFCPGYLAIANDGGNKVALLHAEETSEEVFVNYMSSMAASSMLRTGMVLDEWIENECPFL